MPQRLKADKDVRARLNWKMSWRCYEIIGKAGERRKESKFEYYVISLW